MDELIQVIKTRRSIRRFEPGTISEEIIRDILDCARLAPSANNIQPWLFGVVTEPNLKRNIAELTDSGKFIRDCAVCFAVFADSLAGSYLEGGCAATENILLACTAYGIGSCWVAGHRKHYADSVTKLLNVPEPYVLISLVATGFSKDKPSPQKKSLNDIVFFNRSTADEMPQHLAIRSRRTLRFYLRKGFNKLARKIDSLLKE